MMKNNKTQLFDSFPNTHIKPYDGMAITAEVWEEAHEEHRQANRAHDLIFHGSGIVSGLKVEANDPPDQIVFISPGMAIDSVGNLITITERIAYDFGKASEGQLFLVLGHGAREIGGVEKEIRYAKDEFVLSARSSIPKRPYVEIARINLKKMIIQSRIQIIFPIYKICNNQFSHLKQPGHQYKINNKGKHKLNQLNVLTSKYDIDHNWFETLDPGSQQLCV